ncbi:5,10-methylenetetrahydrofolate reductase / homolog of homocysteine-binding domain [Lachnospiraceae bacterium KM106-2]|nr:5,10-methylenetetrahydrofolate reductase / homolog of homocysteine-binding domain [Lachnospiraceae bacterium KM106-2]
MNFREYIKNHFVITDGAMGTYYSRLTLSDNTVSEFANISDPDLIAKIHREYILAGASLIRTNTFAANTQALNITEAEQEKLLRSACKIASNVAKEFDQEVYLAGSIGPIPENQEVERDEILNEYKRMCDILIEEKVDVILFETFSDYTYIEQLVPYIRSKSDVFLMANFCLDKNGYTKAGISLKRIFATLSEIEELDACGLNCGVGSGHMLEILSKESIPKNKYIAAIPNAGYPERLQNRMVFFDNANYFKENMEKIQRLGIHIIGGCCGTTPTYIRKLRKEGSFVTCEQPDKNIVSMQKVNIVKTAVNNTFYNKLMSGEKVVAVELDPPYDANYEKLMEQALTVKNSGADIITMADSPMGRSRVDSILMSVKLHNQIGVEVMPHISCRDKNMIGMRSGLLGAYINDVRNLLLVTGDPVPSDSRMSTSNVFDYNSIRLMEFTKEMNEEHFNGNPFIYGGALNYGRGRVDKVMERMEKKIAAGATYFLTQPVYSEEDIERLRFIRSKLDTKILIGIMPFVSYRNANFIKNEMTGIFVPDDIVARYHPDMSKEEAEWVGANLASEIIEKVQDFADGYYFMLPFNRVSMLEKIRIQ